MALANLTDIQAWLGRDKIQVDDASSKGPLIEAERLIRGQLATSIPILTITSWTTPDDTPELIRGIVGRLTAAFMYRDIYSEETPEISAYAQELYNEALAIIADIKAGHIILIGVDGNPITDDVAPNLGFWPDATVASKFTMDQEFA